MINPPVNKGRPAAKLAGPWHSLIGEDLEKVEAALQQAFAPYRPRFGSLIKHLSHYRGKRLRPTLLLLVAHACGKTVPAHHVLAAVVEMIHTATLVHDDVLDDASTRRHVPTVNAGWGNKTSILLGDLLFTHAFHLSATIGDARACEWIGAATNRVCAGELQQTVECGNLDLCEADYFAMIEGKTAALTECCGRLGAYYAGACPATVTRLAEFGANLGVAFQIADDVLDLIGDEGAAGKTLGTDLAQRKLTLPLIYLLERASAVEAVEFRRRLHSPDCEHRQLLDALRENGSLDAAQRRAEAYADRARELLSGLPPSPYRTMLESICGWAVRRSA
jgi:octaprenyl-diphosphate synthase